VHHRDGGIVNAEQLLGHVSEMLGFQVTERENDAVLVREPGLSGRSSVRPATREEVTMYLRLLGLAARLAEVSEESNALREKNNDMYAILNAADSRANLAQAAQIRAEAEWRICHENCDKLYVENERLKAAAAELDGRLSDAEAEARTAWEQNETLKQEFDSFKEGHRGGGCGVSGNVKEVQA
jgi:predicted nuclease with TOPRIM domain